MENNCFTNRMNEDSISSGRLNLISSPVKISLLGTNTKQDTTPIQMESTISQAEGKENFAMISTQFSSLVQQLSKIYTEIGYSKSDVSKNEKKLFSSVSNTLDQFLNDSINFKDSLIKENGEIIQNLKIILNILDDQTGSKTIPDLYIRNLILKPSQENSTLLSIRKSLEMAITHVSKKYQEIMLKYLAQCLDLNKLLEKLENHNFKEIQIPNLDNSISICNVFESATSPSEIYEMISADPKTFFENESLKDLSIRKFESISNQIKIHEQFLKERINFLKEKSNEILGLWETLAIDYTVDYSSLSDQVVCHAKSDADVESLNVGASVVNQFDQILGELKELYETRFQQKQKYQVQCEELWVKLNEDETQIGHFKQSNQSLSIQSIDNYSRELQRLLELKKLLLKDLILDARNTIETLWDKLLYSTGERDKFTAFHQETFDDDLLTLHENEIEILNKKYESYKPILESVQQFKDLMSDKKKLEESSKDSSRLLQRNSHKILMEEEKIRKKLARQLPKIVSSLKLKLSEFEKDYGTPFSFLDTELMSELEEQEQSLESKNSRRVVSGGSTAPTRSSSRAPTRPTTRAPSRQPSRQPSRMTSRATSRVTSPTKPVPATTNPRYPPPTQGIRKPAVPTFKRPTLGTKPSIQTSQSCLLPKLSSPPKDTKLNIMPNMIKDHTRTGIRRTPIRAIPSFQRSTSSFQPRLSRLDEQVSGSPKARRTRLSPLKESTRSNLPVLSKGSNNIVTSPLKSLKKDGYSSEEKEHKAMDLISSDDEEDNDTYSRWRREQLRKLNKPSINLSQDTF